MGGGAAFAMYEREGKVLVGKLGGKRLFGRP